MGLLLLFFPIATYAAAAEQISLSRYFTTTVCDAEKQCVGPTVKDLEAANVRLSLAPFRKGGREGLDAWDRNSVVDGGITFKSEIHLIRRERPGKHRYYLYAMLRSGNREGVVKKIRLQSLDELKQVVLEDKPVKTARGTIQAQLVLGPVLPLDVPNASE